jgi:hypothetical protein
MIGRPATVRHIPRIALRAMAVMMRHINLELGRQAQAAVAMDTIDMTFDPARTFRTFPTVPTTDVRPALAPVLS